MQDRQGPVFIRLSRAVEPPVYHSIGKYKIGKSSVLREGKDITLIAYGASVGNAILAADSLEKEGISAGIIDMAFIKPIDKDAIKKQRFQPVEY